MKAVKWDRAIRGDSYAYYAHLRRHAPVMWARIPTRGSGWVVSRYCDVATVLKDPRFSNDPRRAADPPLFGFGGRYAPRLIRLFNASMVCVDDPAHARLRKLVSQAFTPQTVAAMEGWIEGAVEAMLDRVVPTGRMDVIGDLSLPLPLLVISELLGVPEERRLTFHHQITRLIEVNDQPIRRTMRWLPALPRLTSFFEELIDLRRRQPDGRIIARLLQIDDGGDALTQDELIAMIFLLLFAGHETSVNLIGNSVLALLDHADQLALLRERPELMDGAVDELLRFTNPVEYGTMRFATEDVTLAGVSIAKGDMVMALQSSANRDGAAFADPDRLDVTRTGNRHLALGMGPHYCLGATLGRMETRIALNALLRRCPNLALATPREALRWRQSTGLRGLVELPVTFGT